MKDEILYCPECGTYKQNNTSICKKCGYNFCEGKDIRGNEFNRYNAILLFIKFIIYVCCPIYLIYLAKTIVFNSGDSLSSYESALLTLSYHNSMLLLGLAGFITIVMWILLIYNEILLGKMRDFDKKLESIRRAVIDNDK